MDPDFTIERPKRYYRQGLSLLHPESQNEEKPRNSEDRRVSINTDYSEHMSLMGSIRRVLHVGNHRARTTSDVGRQGQRDDSSSNSSNSSVSSRAPTPMLDPSTNINPLDGTNDVNDAEKMGEEHPWSNNKKKKKPNVNEVSKHTFFITNSQMRLKLFARNQVCGIHICEFRPN